MDDPNITMEEYIKFEEEKAHRRGRVFDWQTATYGKIRVDDDLYDLRSMEAEFPAIIIDDAFEPHDALQCKSQVSTPVNDEIDFIISFDESDDEDYIIICDKNSFSYKMIYVNNLKTDSENDYEKVMPSIPSPEPVVNMVLPPREQRHRFLRYEGLEYTDSDIAAFKLRMVMEHRYEAGVVVFTSQAWGRLFSTRGPLVWELILEFLSTLRFGEFILALALHTEEEMGSLGFARDPILRLCHRMMAHSIAGRSQAPEKTGAHISGGQFVAQLAKHFGLLTAEIVGGLTVIALKLQIIDMAELVRLQICMQVYDTWAWVAMGPQRQPDAVAGAPKVAQDALIVDEGGQAIPAPVQAPQQPPLSPPAPARTMP
ncbi:hypothetical protein Tco_0520656 [Tanacetum coccineum]